VVIGNCGGVEIARNGEELKKKRGKGEKRVNPSIHAGCRGLGSFELPLLVYGSWRW
jgi:hypothetical protein